MALTRSRIWLFVLAAFVFGLLAIGLLLVSSGHLDLGHHALSWAGSIHPDIMYGN